MQSILESFTKQQPLSVKTLTGEWRKIIDTDLTTQISTPDSQAVLKIGDIPQVCRVSFSMQGNAKEMGFALHATDEFVGNGYYYALDRGKQQLTYTSGGRTTGNGYSYPFDGELGRNIGVNEQTVYNLEILIDEDLTVVYINDEIALTARHANTEGNGFYLMCYGGEATFENVAIWTK